MPRETGTRQGRTPIRRGPTKRGGPHRGPTTGGEGHTGPTQIHTQTELAFCLREIILTKLERIKWLFFNSNVAYPAKLIYVHTPCLRTKRVFAVEC